MKHLYVIGLYKTRQLTEYIEDNIDFNNSYIWTVNDWYNHFSIFSPDKVFQVHSEHVLDKIEYGKVRYIDWRKRYNDSGASIVTPEDFTGVDNIEKFPIQIIKDWGVKYFTSSLAYILTYAHYLNMRSLTLLGFNMGSCREYMYQLPKAREIISKLRSKGFYIDAPLDEYSWVEVDESFYTPSYIYNMEILEEFTD